MYLKSSQGRPTPDDMPAREAASATDENETENMFLEHVGRARAWHSGPTREVREQEMT
jgi:hypothetical protein